MRLCNAISRGKNGFKYGIIILLQLRIMETKKLFSLYYSNKKYVNNFIENFV